MKGIRTALLSATSDRYFTLAANFVSIVIVSRLLAPEEIGFGPCWWRVCIDVV
jgi:hypothetical protein